MNLEQLIAYLEEVGDLHRRFFRKSSEAGSETARGVRHCTDRSTAVDQSISMTWIAYGRGGHVTLTWC